MAETYKIQIVVEGQDNASAPLGKVGSALGGLGSIAGGILTAGILTSIASGIAGLAKEALTAYSDYERLGMSLQALTARELVNTGQATDMASALNMASGQAEDLQGWVQQLAIKSPFKQSDIADSFRLAMAYGFQTDEAQRLTSAMVDYTSATGASGDVMGRISLALGQIKARGKLAGQEIMQLTEAGIPVRQILADSFGVTTAELEDMISKGLVPADEAINAIVTSMEEDFGGSAERQAGTFSGLISSLSDIKEVGLREFFEGTFKAIQPYAQSFVDLLSDPATMEKISQFGQKIGTGISGALDFFSKAKDSVGGFFDRLKENETVQAVIENVSNAFQNFGTFWAENGEGITTTVSDLFTKIGETLGPVAADIVTMISGAFEKVSAWFIANGPMIQTVLDGISIGIGFIVEAVANMLPAFKTTFDFVVNTLMNIGTMLLQIFTGDFAGAFDTFTTILSDIVNTVIEQLQNLAVWVLETFFGMTFEEATAKVQQAMEDLKTWFENLKLKATEVIDSIKQGFVDFKQKIQDVIDKIATFFNNLADFVLPDWVEKLFGLMGGGSTTISGRAIGGPVRSGETYLVGENGPELFRPNISGQIIPNDRLSSVPLSDPSQAVVKNFNITVNNNGGSMNERDLAAALNQWEWAYGF